MNDYSSSPLVRIFRHSSTILGFQNEELAASEIADLACSMAAGLAESGLMPGDRVGLWMANGRSYVQAFLACAAAGLVVVPINLKYSDLEVESLLVRCGVRLVVSDRDRLPAAADGVASLVSIGDLSGPVRPASEQSHELGPSRCVIFTTSGTTSLPKLVAHTQSSLADHARDIADNSGYSEADTALIAMPLGGTFGLTSLLGAVATGCRSVLVPNKFEVLEAANLIQRARVTLINGSDDMFHRLLDTPADLSSVRIGGYARFNTSLDGIVERAQERGMTLTGLYGMSEVQALFTIRDPKAGPAVRARAGGSIISPKAHARIVEGELQLRGPSLFEGYLAEGGSRIDSELTASVMANGWFRTGDSATQPTNEGSVEVREFTFVARIGDVLRIGGYLVAPSEIEKVLMSFPGIERAQVVAVDQPSGARPVAFVTLGDPAATINEDAVKAHCLLELAKFKTPVRVVVVEDFPKVDGPNGPKVQRNELRAMADSLAGLAD